MPRTKRPKLRKVIISKDADTQLSAHHKAMTLLEKELAKDGGWTPITIEDHTIFANPDNKRCFNCEIKCWMIQYAD